MRHHRLLALLATPLFVLVPAVTGYVPARGSAALPRLLTLRPRVASADAAGAGRTVLVLSSTRMVALQADKITASLNRPLDTGRMTFTLVRPAPSAALFSCTPVRGACSMLWSRRTAGAVTIAVRWSGDRHDRSISASLSVAVRPSRYAETGVWRGARVGPLTRVGQAIAGSWLSHAAVAGRLQGFRSSDPAYACDARRSLRVFTAPATFPDEYVVFAPASGARCPAGTWLFPQQANVSPARPVVGAAHTVALVQGVFPGTFPGNAAATFYVRAAPRAVAAIVSWNAAGIAVLVPAHLSPQASAVQVSWYDRWTGDTLRTALVTIRRVSGTIVPTIIPPTTKVLSRTTLRTLIRPPGGKVNAAASHLTLTFPNTTAAVRALRPGDVLVSGVTPVTPYGMLRKITSIAVRGPHIVIQTVPGKLTEAITQGVIEVHIALTRHGTIGPHIRRAALAPQDSKPTPTLCAQTSDQISVTTPTEGTSVGTEVEANASACYGMAILFKVTIVPFTPVQTVFSVTAVQQLHAGLSVADTGKAEWKHDTPIPTGIPPIPIDVGLPIVLVPQLNFRVGVEGDLSAGLQVGATRTDTLTAGIACQNATCARLYHHPAPDVTADPAVMAEAQAKFYAGPHLELLVNGIVGPELGLQTYLEATAAPTDNPWFTLYYGLEGTIGMDLNLVVVTLSAEYTLADLRVLLLQSSGPFPGLGGTPTAGSAPPPPPSTGVPSTPPTPAPSVSPTTAPAPTSPGPPPPPAPTLCAESLTLAPSSGPPGTTVTVAYQDDCDNVSVSGQVFFDGTQLTTFASADDTGWTGQVTVPASAPSGPQSISIQDSDGSSQSATFTVVGGTGVSPTNTPTPLPSHNVAYITDFGAGLNDTAGPGSGSSIFVNAVTGSPIGAGDTGTYEGVNFTDVPISTIDANPSGALSGFDTAILYEVCSIGDAANAAALSAINTFLANGGKLLIFDADACSISSGGRGETANYASFLYPFTTDSPGPRGAGGSYTWVEPSALTADVNTPPTDPSFDALGDANVFTSNSGGWCGSLAATNVDNATGYVETYVRTPKGGLAIYSGEDFWYTDQPSVHLQQVFDNMLAQPWNPDNLPCTDALGQVALTPASATDLVGTAQTETAAVVNSIGQPETAVPVTLSVQSGPDAGLIESGVTDGSGQVTFTFTDTNSSGTDIVVASFVDPTSGATILSGPATITWNAPATATPTDTPLPTDTATSTPTDTPTATSTTIDTPTPTSTLAVTPSSTSTVTDTPGATVTSPALKGP